MSKAEKITAGALSLLFALAAFLFFGLEYPYHIHYQEEYQLFENTLEYFASTAGIPGGFADWCGRALTQFFYYAWAGAGILALLLAGVQLATVSAFKTVTPFSYSLSFLPAVCLWFALCDENFIPGAVVAVLLATLCGALAAKAPDGRWKPALTLAGIPFAYFLFGPVAVLYAVIALKGQKPWTWIAGIIVAAACPLAGQFIFAYPLRRLSFGIHYHRVRNVFVTWMWVGVAASALECIFFNLGHPLFRKPVRGIAGGLAAAATAAFVFFSLGNLADSSKEESMKYGFMARMQMWNRTMTEADRLLPHNPMCVTCLNLALAKSGRMQDYMFDYFQNGPEGLLPAFNRDFITPLPTAEVYWQLGLVNTAQRYFFEAQEAIPDFQKSARCYKMLAQTNIVNGDYDVARKYLTALSHTIFYKDWALGMLSACEGRDESLAPRLRNHDFFFSQEEMDSILGLLYTENPDNRMALDYMLAWCLLRKDLPRFVQCLSVANFQVLPQTYQEALLLYVTNLEGGPAGIPVQVSQACISQMQEFVAAYKAGTSQEDMEKRFGRTYWYYYIYRYN